MPGLGLNLQTTRLDLTYKQRYNTHLPDAYERLILDCFNGDKRLFIRNDELAAAWEIFTPILKVHTATIAEQPALPYENATAGILTAQSQTCLSCGQDRWPSLGFMPLLRVCEVLRYNTY